MGNHLIFIEPESFSDLGRWVIDQNSMDVIGSSYWHDSGMIPLDKGDMELTLHDMTGFNVRYDAQLLTSDARSHFQMIPNRCLSLGKNGPVLRSQ